MSNFKNLQKTEFENLKNWRNNERFVESKVEKEESYDTSIINQQLVEQEANMALSSKSWKWLFIQEKSGQDFFFALVVAQF